jgi:hypothetical protein
MRAEFVATAGCDVIGSSQGQSIENMEDALLAGRGPMAASVSAAIMPPKTAINEMRLSRLWVDIPLLSLCCLSLLMTALSQLLGKGGLNYLARLQTLLRNLVRNYWGEKLSSLCVVAKRVRTKSPFVSRFSTDVTSTDIEKSLNEQLKLTSLTCTRLKTKFHSYALFHISVAEDDFHIISNTGVSPSGC